MPVIPVGEIVDGESFGSIRGKLNISGANIEALDLEKLSNAANEVEANNIAADAVTTVKILNANVTKAKIENVASMRVLGNVTGAPAAPAEVVILDSDTMTGALATNIPTAESVKAYVDNRITAIPAFSPLSYNGIESVTFPNGLIMKWGRVARTGNTTQVTFGAQFPTAVVNISITIEDTANDNVANSANVGNIKSKAGFNIRSGTGPTHFFWQAIGY